MHTAVICRLPMLGLGQWAMTKSQHFTGSCCLNLTGKSNLHYTKMNHTLSRNRFPLSCVTLFPRFDRTISSISFLIRKGSWEYIFWDPAFLKTSWVYPYIWLMLWPYFTLKIIFLQNSEGITSGVAIGYHWFQILYTQPAFSLWRILGFMIMCFGLVPPIPIHCVGSSVGPSNLEAHVLQFWGIFLYYVFDSFLFLSFASRSHYFALCSTFQDSSSTLSSNFPTEFFVSASCVFLNSQELLLFFKPSSLRHSVLTL